MNNGSAAAAVGVGDSNESSLQNDRDAEAEEGIIDASQSDATNASTSACKFWAKKRIVTAGFSSVALVAAGTAAAVGCAVLNTPPPDNSDVSNEPPVVSAYEPGTDVEIQMAAQQPCKNWCHSNNQSWSIKCDWKNCKGCDPHEAL